MSWFRRKPAPTTGVSEGMLEGLRYPDPGVRAAAIRSCGSARMEAAIPLLSERLADPHPRVRAAAASALGRIGGSRAADALVRAARARRVPAGRLARELARCAPDHYLEAALLRPENRGVRPLLAVAAGLRGRSPAIVPLLVEMAASSSEAERTAAYHALGALGEQGTVPMLVDALFDASPRAQQSARCALRRLGALAPTDVASPRKPPPPERLGLRRLLPVGRKSRTLT
jgi:hypothetical protein